MASLRNILTAVVLFVLLVCYPTAAPEYSDWSAPLNLGAVVNSPSIDAGPAVSKDGLSLYFNSNRLGGCGKQDIWVSQRASPESPWGPPVNLECGVVNTRDFFEAVPALSRDEHWLFFNSNRSPGFGQNDIWASYREHTKDDFGWQTPVNLGDGVNSPFLDVGAGYFENDDAGAPLLFFGSDRPGGAVQPDIYVSQLFPDGSFGPASVVAELNSPAGDYRPSVRFDGLEVFVHSDRLGSLGDLDLWVATRQTVFDFWSTPANLGSTVNSTDREQQPYIAADRETLYFASNRPDPDGSGGLDLYVTTRTKVHER